MDVEAELARAIALHRERRLDEASAAYEAVLAVVPDHTHALSVSAILMFERGLREAAIGRMASAIASAPDFPALHNNLGNMLKIEGRMMEAVASYQRALELDPNQPEALNNAGVIYREQKRTDEAAQLFERAVELDPEHVEANHNLALILAARGEFDRAADCLERCYARGEVPRMSILFHIRLLRMIGRPERAEELMRIHAANRSDDPIVAYESAALLGESLDAVPSDYIRAKFDRFAPSFDSNLAMLGYDGPERVAKIVATLCENGPVETLVDLGCGTGLLAPLVRQHARKMIGVDLAPQMLRKAAERVIDDRPAYDALYEGDVVEFLEQQPPGSIDLAVAVDTVIYIGKIEPLFAALGRALKKGGGFVATFEWTHSDQKDGIRLLENGRFAHATLYLRDAASAAMMVQRSCQLCSLRKEFGEEIPFTLQVFQRVDDDPSEKSVAQ